MPGDRTDRVLGLLLVTAVVALAMVLAGAGPQGGTASATTDRDMQQALAYQAQAAFLHKLYAPVEALAKEGKPAQALLKLDQIGRSHPDEAYGYILQGELLQSVGSLAEAAHSYVRGLRLDGDYVDNRSPLNRRTKIRQLVNRGLALFGAEAKAQPDSPAPAAALKDLHYLQSRLAGGCE